LREDGALDEAARGGWGGEVDDAEGGLEEGGVREKVLLLMVVVRGRGNGG
jgi:hypothetical protein